MSGQAGQHDIAKRYAKAFFELVQEQGQIDVIEKDLGVMASLCDSGEDFAAFIDNPSLKRGDQAKALVEISKHLKLSPLSLKLLGTLAEKRRLPEMKAVVEATLSLIAEHKGEVTAEVIAAQALDQKQISEIAGHLKKILGKDVRVNLSVNDEIIGGLIVKIGSRLIDSSVRTKLERLHRALKNTNSTSDQKKMKEVA